MTKPLCTAPFKNIRINVFASEQMTFRPCCNFDNYNAEHNSVQDYLASDLLKNTQTQMYTELPSACSACTRQEAQGQISLRQHYNNRFTDLDGIAQLETFPSNVCNLRCFMCSEDSSTSLAAERRQLGWIESYQEVDNADATMDAIASLPDLSVVSFIGGEFFLAKRNVEILNQVAQRKLGIRLVTNATILLPQHIQALKQIKDIMLQISIDGINENYEFMRYPGRWADVHHNIHQLKQELPHARFNFNFVVQPLNIQHMVETIDYANRLIVPIALTNLIDPTWLSWAILTEDETNMLANRLEEQSEEAVLTSRQRAQCAEYATTMTNSVHDPALRAEFVQRMSQLLTHRRITPDATRKQLGDLRDLADSIIAFAPSN
jgi:molybdenum cofactor biosynthesis enzyme MoaA